jgi:hypothetical protein
LFMKVKNLLSTSVKYIVIPMALMKPCVQPCVKIQTSFW